MGGVILCLSFCLAVSWYKGLTFKKIGEKLSLMDIHKEDAPDYWCLYGWTRCLQKMNITSDVCFFGHSQIASSDFQRDFPEKRIVELGYPGDNIIGMKRRISQIVAVHPQMVFVMAGTNSLRSPKEMFEQSYGDLLLSIKDSVPSAKIYCFNIIPQRTDRSGRSERNEVIRERNSFIASFCRRNNFPLIDTYQLFVDEQGDLNKDYSIDGVHINTKGYKMWAKLLEPYIMNDKNE